MDGSGHQKFQTLPLDRRNADGADEDFVCRRFMILDCPKQPSRRVLPYEGVKVIVDEALDRPFALELHTLARPRQHLPAKAARADDYEFLHLRSLQTTQFSSP